MCVGGSLAAPRLAIGFALDWVLLLVVVSVPLVHYRIILREEALSGTQVRQRIPALQDEDPTILVAILRALAFSQAMGSAN